MLAKLWDFGVQCHSPLIWYNFQQFYATLVFVFYKMFKSAMTQVSYQYSLSGVLCFRSNKADNYRRHGSVSNYPIGKWNKMSTYHSFRCVYNNKQGSFVQHFRRSLFTFIDKMHAKVAIQLDRGLSSQKNKEVREF